jgi:hypothetical protein
MGGEMWAIVCCENAAPEAQVASELADGTRAPSFAT